MTVEFVNNAEERNSEIKSILTNMANDLEDANNDVEFDGLSDAYTQGKCL